MNRPVIGVALVAASVFVVACGSSSKSSSNSSNSSSTTAVSASTSTPGYGGVSSTTTVAGAKAVLGVAMNAKVHQNILVDANGMTVYSYKPDGTSTTTKVPAALMAAWPAVTSTSGTPSVGAGLSRSGVTVNGQHQVAYNHHLLYTFAADKKPGDANGQGLGGIWHVVAANGTPIG